MWLGVWMCARYWYLDYLYLFLLFIIPIFHGEISRGRRKFTHYTQSQVPHPNLRRPRRTSPSASTSVLPCSFVMLAAMRLCKIQVGIIIHTWQTTIKYSYKNTVLCHAYNRVQELCESWGGRPGLSVLTSLLVSVYVKQYWAMLWHWSQLDPNMSTDNRGL